MTGRVRGSRCQQWLTPCIHLSSLVVNTDCKLLGAGTITFHVGTRLWPISTSDHSTDDVPSECLFSEDLNNIYSSLQFLGAFML